jgi:hypothetical protein
MYMRMAIDVEQVLSFNEQEEIVSASHLLLFDLRSLIWFNVQRIKDIYIIALLENLFLFGDRCSDTLGRE